LAAPTASLIGRVIERVTQKREAGADDEGGNRQAKDRCVCGLVGASCPLVLRPFSSVLTWKSIKRFDRTAM
jgi:hypothetical protein